MIYVGDQRRSSQVRPESIDLRANRQAIQTMLQAASRHGSPLLYGELGVIRPDLRSEFIGQYQDVFDRAEYIAERARFSSEDFETVRRNQTIGTGVDLRMRPEDTTLRGSLYNLAELGLHSTSVLPHEVRNGNFLGTVMLRSKSSDPDSVSSTPPTYRDVDFDIDFHSVGTVIMRGHLNTLDTTQSGFWEKLHLDGLTPLEPNIRHEIFYEPLSTPQVTALASYVLERLPEITSNRS